MIEIIETLNKTSALRVIFYLFIAWAIFEAAVHVLYNITNLILKYKTRNKK